MELLIYIPICYCIGRVCVKNRSHDRLLINISINELDNKIKQMNKTLLKTILSSNKLNKILNIREKINKEKKYLKIN